MSSGPIITRTWAMPSSRTFTIPPIRLFISQYLQQSQCSVDPYAGNSGLATFTNDLNPNTSAIWHLDAIDFLAELAHAKVRADLVLIDPPYSPRQVKECYDNVGQKMNQGDALLGSIRKRLKTQICQILVSRGVVITCGWNTVGMGKSLGFTLEKVLLCCHGSDHNDTLITVERW